MPRIFCRLPYIHSNAHRPPLLIGAASGCQVVLHLGIAPPERKGEAPEVPPPNTAPVPVILDTGFTHGLLLRQSYLSHLTLTPIQQYRETDFPKLSGKKADLIRRRRSGTGADAPEKVPLRRGRLWFYPNRPGTCDRDVSARPIFLPLPRGIIIARDDLTPADMASPLLGLGGFNDCDLFALAHAGHLDLWSGRPSRLWWFLRGLRR